MVKSNHPFNNVMMFKFITCALTIVLAIFPTTAQTKQICPIFPVRTEISLTKGWKFTRDEQVAKSLFDLEKNLGWEDVTVPHDWAIYGPFSIENDKQKVAISQDGQKAAMEHAGRTGGLPFVGKGWYKLRFDVPAFSKDKKVQLIFDGAMSCAEVYINGEKAGFWPYGYNSFVVDITPYVKTKDNLLTVKLENKHESSRWYPGAGLYRNVHLLITNVINVPLWSRVITTPYIDSKHAKVRVETPFEIYSSNHKNFKNLKIKTFIKDMDGKVVAESEAIPDRFYSDKFIEEIEVKHPSLWSVDNPYLYTAESQIFNNGKLEDKVATRFGIRSFEIIPGKGAFLNGESIKFKGVCNHHDLGPLGAEVNDAAIRRQIRILKDMGANAIRTSHNMPAPELVEACDEMGMMLMCESFDEWKKAKVANGYHLYFDSWVEKDLQNLIRHYRNAPSVIMWCIGNEVPDQYGGIKLAKELQDICHREDPTRYVTQGMDQPTAVLDNGMAAIMDVPGFNYRSFRYQECYDRLPQKIILGSETVSTVSSRGVYEFPVERAAMKKYPNHQSSSYDLEHCAWSDLPEDNWIWHDSYPWSIGEFVWTGFDYLGEPTPYYTDWPSHSSLFGIIDLAGLPKDRYYLYRSHWNNKEETLHILPHWNWKGREGENTPIFVYTNYPSAELFINGVSQGKRTKDMSVTVENSSSKEDYKAFKRQRRYRLMWMDTKYEPGVVKVVAYDEQGNPVAEKEMHTAGKPYRIMLEADRRTIKADGKDLSFITVKVVDRHGNLCPNANMEISFSVSGDGHYKAGANGDPTSLESFQKPEMKVFNGMMTAIVQSDMLTSKDGNLAEISGKIVLKARAKGLRSGKCEIRTKK